MPVRLILTAALLALPASLLAQAEDPTLEAVRAATEKYTDVEVALADGYVPAGMCVSAAMEGLPAELGAMGIHYLHPERFGITAMEPRVDGTGTHTDFLTPGILIYEPQADGSLELVAIENLVFEEAWLAAGNEGPPVFQGRTWDRMADDPDTEGDEAHGFVPHYDQHVWLYRENPSGTLEPFNPAVTCEHAAHAAEMAPGADSGS